MLVQDIQNKVLAMIDNYTEDGVVVSASDNIDIAKKVILFTDMAQKENWKLNQNTKQVVITHKPPVNQVQSNSELVNFEGEIQYIPDETGVANVRGYSIQVDGDCTLKYQENVAGTWTDLTTLTITGITEMTTYKGVLAVADTTNRVRLKIDGTTHFYYQNVALWKYLYATDKVPTCQPFVKYDLPDDFNAVEMVVKEYSNVYDQLSNYRIENFKDFYYDNEFDGKIRITYHPLPTTITALTDEIQIDEALAQSIVYDVVAKIGFYENPDLINWAEGRRLESKQEANINDPKPAEIITDYYE